jgi:AcrR family transcriptional regulator
MDMPGAPSEATEIPSARGGSDAPSQLIRAAERLFSERGIDGVSLREITRQAGQRNSTALQYHFRDRDGLLRGLVDKHVEQVAARRAALLDSAEGRSDITLRDGACILVQPLVSKLVSADGGPAFLQIAAELMNRADRVIEAAEPVGPLLYDSLGTMDRWAGRFSDLMPEGTAGAPLHRRFAVIRFVHIEVGRRARIGPPIDVPLFTNQLVDMTTALLGAELSEETKRLLARRGQTP